jgi:poly-gamma-glutamate synthase PgsB/CapB
MAWLPIVVSLALFAWLFLHWWITSHRAKVARDHSDIRIVVTGSRGKSGTVRLVHSVLSHSGIRTYAKITGAIAEELNVDGDSRFTLRIGPISATEMLTAVKRGSRNKAQALVFECMAVLPKLIAFVVNEVVKPTIVIIPTIRLDHLEDEGHSLEEITANIVTPLLGFETLITGDSDIRVLQTLRTLSKEHGFKLVEAHVHDSQPEVFEQHPVNIAIALAVATQVGIPHEKAREAILGVTHEPNAGIGWWMEHHGKRTFIADLGSANDVQSAAEAIDGVRDYLGRDVPIIPVIANRWDRPLRGRSFVAAAALTPGDLPIVLSGDAYPQSRMVARDLGLPRKRIKRLHVSSALTKGSVQRLFNHWQGDEPVAAVLLLENMHSTGVRLLRSTVTRHSKAVYHDRTEGARS